MAIPQGTNKSVVIENSVARVSMIEKSFQCQKSSKMLPRSHNTRSDIVTESCEFNQSMDLTRLDVN